MLGIETQGRLELLKHAVPGISRVECHEIAACWSGLINQNKEGAEAYSWGRMSVQKKVERCDRKELGR